MKENKNVSKSLIYLLVFTTLIITEISKLYSIAIIVFILILVMLVIDFIIIPNSLDQI